MKHLGFSPQSDTYLCTVHVHSLANIPLLAGLFRVRWKFLNEGKSLDFKALGDDPANNSNSSSSAENSDQEVAKSRKPTVISTILSSEEEGERRPRISSFLSTQSAQHRGAFSESQRPRSKSSVSRSPGVPTLYPPSSLSMSDTDEPSHHSLTGDLIIATSAARPRLSVSSASSNLITPASRYAASTRASAQSSTLRPRSPSQDLSNSRPRSLSLNRPSVDSQRRLDLPNLSIQTDIHPPVPPLPPLYKPTDSAQTSIHKVSQPRAQPTGSTPQCSLDVASHSVVFDHTFKCPVAVYTRNSVIQPCYLKLSIRQEEVASEVHLVPKNHHLHRHFHSLHSNSVGPIPETTDDDIKSPTAPLTGVPPSASQTSYIPPWEMQNLQNLQSLIPSSVSSSTLHSSLVGGGVEGHPLSPQTTITPKPSRETITEPLSIPDKIPKRKEQKMGKVMIDLTKYLMTNKKEVKFLLYESKTNATLRLTITMKRLGQRKKFTQLSGPSVSSSASLASSFDLSASSASIFNSKELPPPSRTLASRPNTSNYAPSVKSFTTNVTRSDTQDTHSTQETGTGYPNTLRELLEFGDPSRRYEKDETMMEVIELLRLSRPEQFGGPIKNILSRSEFPFEPFPSQEGPAEEKEREGAHVMPPSPKISFWKWGKNQQQKDDASFKGFALSAGDNSNNGKDDDAKSVKSIWMFSRTKKTSLNAFAAANSSTLTLDGKEETSREGDREGRRSIDSVHSMRPSLRSRKSSKGPTSTTIPANSSPNIENDPHSTVKMKNHPVFTSSPRNSMDSYNPSSIQTRKRTKSTKSSSGDKTRWVGLGLRTINSTDVYDLENEEEEEEKTELSRSILTPKVVITDSRSSTEQTAVE